MQKIIRKEIKKLINQRGFFGVIKAEVSPDISESSIIFKLESDLESKYFNAVRFGFDYFMERFKKESNKNLSVSIIDLEYNPVDSTSIIYFYLIVSILIEYTDFEINSFVFNSELGLFEVPH